MVLSAPKYVLMVNGLLFALECEILHYTSTICINYPVNHVHVPVCTRCVALLITHMYMYMYMYLCACLVCRDVVSTV